MEILVISIANTLILLWVAYLTRKPKTIEIREKIGPEKELRKTAIYTPSGAFVVPEKRAPVYNDDESLYEREQEKKQ